MTRVSDVVIPLNVEVDQIYHLASAETSVPYRSGVDVIKTNVLGTMNMLELSVRLRARFLLASTCKIYGNRTDASVATVNENFWGYVDPIGVHACHDESKRLDESLCFEYWRVHGLQIRVARIFDTYGPRMPQTDVLSNLIVQALQNQTLTIDGNDTQTRSLCYVADMVRGLCAMMNGDQRGPINLGHSAKYTVR